MPRKFKLCAASGKPQSFPLAFFCLNPEIRGLPEIANHKRETLLYYDDPTSDTSIISYQYHMH